MADSGPETTESIAAAAPAVGAADSAITDIAIPGGAAAPVNPGAEAKDTTPSPAPPVAAQAAATAQAAADSPILPKYTRSLLHIKVPLTVSLAVKKQPLGHILDLGPGSIIHFEKSCEEMLDLHVNNRPFAVGEAVKVGDKFGLRITSLVLPEERFRSVRAAS